MLLYVDKCYVYRVMYLILNKILNKQLSAYFVKSRLCAVLLCQGDSVRHHQQGTVLFNSFETYALQSSEKKFFKDSVQSSEKRNTLTAFIRITRYLINSI